MVHSVLPEEGAISKRVVIRHSCSSWVLRTIAPLPMHSIHVVDLYTRRFNRYLTMRQNFLIEQFEVSNVFIFFKRIYQAMKVIQSWEWKVPTISWNRRRARSKKTTERSERSEQTRLNQLGSLLSVSPPPSTARVVCIFDICTFQLPKWLILVAFFNNSTFV